MRVPRYRPSGMLACGLAVLCGCADSRGAIGPPAQYSQATRELAAFITREMAIKQLPALSVALIDGDDIVWVQGFGRVSPEDSTPASGATAYRAGSIAKLLTGIAVMRLVEQGKLGLDEPIRRYLPDASPRNPFDSVPITIRMLLSHRGGLVREPPAGSSFDTAGVSLAAAATAAGTTTLVYPPGSRAKFSNAGYAILGAIVERVAGMSFEAYVRTEILEPLGMRGTWFGSEAAPDPRRTPLAAGQMWTYDGRESRAPRARFGLAATGDLYTTAADLARLARMFLAGGGGILSASSVEQMVSRQAADSTPAAFGLGFWLSSAIARQWAGQAGSAHGYAAEFALLPAERLGVVVLTAADAANSLPGRIAHAAAILMITARLGGAAVTVPPTEPLPPGLARRVQGRYAGWSGAPAPPPEHQHGPEPEAPVDRRRIVVDLEARNDSLVLHRDGGEIWSNLRALGDTLVADDRLAYGDRILVAGDRIVLNGDTLGRIPAPKPAPPPPRWNALIGEYGWGHDIVYVREDGGRLHALVGWFFDYPLREEPAGRFRMPATGLYHGEPVDFARGAGGRVSGVTIGGVTFPRRAVGPEEGNIFRIVPQRPADELVREALAATPPAQPDSLLPPELTELVALDPTIRLDMRYATTNNFVGTAFYAQPRAFAQRPAAEAAVRAHRKLAAQGYGLLIHDAYRPWYVTKMFWEATPDSLRDFVANPASGSRHNRGAAIDLTLFDRRTGRVIEMVSGYDEFSDRAYPDYPGGTSLQRWHRRLLRQAMETEGFMVNPGEWWHFDYSGWRRYPVLNLRFEEIGRSRR